MAEVIPILQKAGPLTREDNTVIHKAFQAFLKIEPKPENIVQAFCDVRLPFVFDALRMYIRLNKVNATKHFGKVLLPFGEDLVQMASYNKEDSWTLCAYVVQASMDFFISPEKHGYFCELLYEHLLKLDEQFIDLKYRCRVPPHTHEWRNAKSFTTSPPSTVGGHSIFVGSVIDETVRGTPISVQRNFGGMNPSDRFQTVLREINDLFTNFGQLYSKVHAPCWEHSHFWKCKEKDGRKTIKIWIEIEVLPYVPTLPPFEHAISVYDLPTELAKLSKVLDIKLSQPVAPHTHKLRGKEDEQDLCLFIGEKKGIGEVKQI